MENVRGVEVHYYAICKRKLWLFHKGIRFENDGHERVIEGKILHEHAYPKMDKDVELEAFVRIDRQDGDVLREIKLTSKMKKADRLQMLYYLYILKQKGIRKTGLLSYTKEKETVEVHLDDDGEQEVRKALANIQTILEGNIPPFQKLPYCSKCAYKDFCFSGEADQDES
ncbi:CRISPR-associated protein Cas4 [Effusibacillus pohliae]|uniref:CRISPR-associated protein Cas4 n=1 Tax=Effusibacillus pohliae TaxID=232270 RepID=UPI00036D5BBD|nr:CRISPR-associated protein Cas4 [Effusibacillus pohliae]